MFPHGPSSIPQTLAQHSAWCSAWPRYTVSPPPPHPHPRPQCPCPEHQCPGPEPVGNPQLPGSGDTCFSSILEPAQPGSPRTSPRLCAKGCFLPRPVPKARVQKRPGSSSHLRPKALRVRFPGVFISGGYSVGVLNGGGGSVCASEIGLCNKSMSHVRCVLGRPATDGVPSAGASHPLEGLLFDSVALTPPPASFLHPLPGPQRPLILGLAADWGCAGPASPSPLLKEIINNN